MPLHWKEINPLKRSSDMVERLLSIGRLPKVLAGLRGVRVRLSMRGNRRWLQRKNTFCFLYRITVQELTGTRFRNVIFLEDTQQIYKGAVLYTKVPDELSRSVLKLQENAHTHANKNVLDGISSKLVTQWTQSKPKTTVGIGGKITAKATETGTELAWNAILDPSTDNLLKTSQSGLYVPGYTKSEIDEAFTDTQKQLYSDMSGKISGVQAETKAYFDILTGAMGRLTFYINAETGDDSNAGTSVSAP